jgi:hypothetical protein
VWAGLNRLRAISRLVLVAIEQEDLERVAELSRESETIIAALKNHSGPSADAEFVRTLLDEIGQANRRIVEELKERMFDTSRELARTRETRYRLRAAGMPGPAPTSSILDREG